MLHNSMQLSPTFSTLAEHNTHNHLDLLAQLRQARAENPAAEPIAAKCLRWHLAGAEKLFSLRYEIAWKVNPAAPARFAEALFTLKDDRNKPIPSPTVLRTLQTYMPQRRLDSRFRFWMGFQAARTFFEDDTHGCTHLSLNIPAYAAASPYFQTRFENGLSLFEKKHPDKGLILEMLEHQPWNDAQRTTMAHLQQRKVGWAVDDYAAPDGHHSPRSLQLAHEYSATLPPLVKLDGGLLTRSLESDDFSVVCDRVKEADQHALGAFLVLEWVQTADQVAQIYNALNQAGCHTPIGYVQSHGFNEFERRKAAALIAPRP